MKFIVHTPAGPAGWLSKIIAFVLAVAVAVVALMFSAILLVVILAVGSLVLAYAWWKTRELRKVMRSQMQQFSAYRQNAESGSFDGEVIEGEVISVERGSAQSKR